MKQFSIKKPDLIAIAIAIALLWVASFLCGYFPDPTQFEPFLNFVVVNGILSYYLLSYVHQCVIRCHEPSRFQLAAETFTSFVSYLANLNIALIYSILAVCF